MKFHITPANMFAVFEHANEAGIPHWMAQSSYSSNGFTWQRDGDETGYSIELRMDGTWSATMEREP